MKLKYMGKEEVEKELDISSGDTIFNGKEKVKVLAVIDEAIITESPLNPMWSNRVYSAKNIIDSGYVVM